MVERYKHIPLGSSGSCERNPACTNGPGGSPRLCSVLGPSVTCNGSSGPATLARRSTPSLLRLDLPSHRPRNRPHKHTHRSETDYLDHRAPQLYQHKIRLGPSHAPMQPDGDRLRLACLPLSAHRSCRSVPEATPSPWRTVARCRRTYPPPAPQDLSQFPNILLTYATHSRVNHASPFPARLHAAMRYTHLSASRRISARALLSLLRVINESPPKKMATSMRPATIR